MASVLELDLNLVIAVHAVSGQGAQVMHPTGQPISIATAHIILGMFQFIAGRFNFDACLLENGLLLLQQHSRCLMMVGPIVMIVVLLRPVTRIGRLTVARRARGRATTPATTTHASCSNE